MHTILLLDFEIESGLEQSWVQIGSTTDIIVETGYIIGDTEKERESVSVNAIWTEWKLRWNIRVNVGVVNFSLLEFSPLYRLLETAGSRENQS